MKIRSAKTHFMNWVRTRSTASAIPMLNPSDGVEHVPAQLGSPPRYAVKKASRFSLCGMAWQLVLVNLLGTLPLCAQPTAAPLKTRNVFLIITDGFRWQEVFNGAEEMLLSTTEGGVKNTNLIRQKFWAPTPEERRKKLLPFFWTTIAERGQLYGNQTKGSVARVTNGKNFSYPGYSEAFTGRADPRIDSNDKRPNPNVTVFEWLNKRAAYKDNVAAFGSWDVFPYILNRERSGIPVWDGSIKEQIAHSSLRQKQIAEFAQDLTRLWEDVVFDSFLFHASLDYVQQKQPNVVFLGYGETDEWSHSGRYDLYLAAAHNVDRYVKTLWETVQSIPQYRDRTTFIITTDHGRGSGPSEWKNHNKDTKGSEAIWIAILGPDTPVLGERLQTEALTQSQIAATLAAFLGEDFRAAFPEAAPSIREAFPKWR